MRTRFRELYSFILLGISCGCLLANAQHENLFPDEFPARREHALRQLVVAREILISGMGEQTKDVSSSTYGWALISVIKGQLAQEDFPGAEATAAAIPIRATSSGSIGFLGVHPRDHARDLVAKAELAKGDLSAATRTALAITYRPPDGSSPSLENEYPDRVGIIQAVIRKYVETRDYDHALSAVRALAKPARKIDPRFPPRNEDTQWVADQLSETAAPIWAALSHDGRADEAR